MGLVSTARVTHATPSAVYSKSVDRNFEDNLPDGCTEQKDIVTQMIDAMEAGLVDVALGGGRRDFIPESVTDEEGKTGHRKDGVNLIERATGLGAQYVYDDTTLAAAALDGTPLLGLFESSPMQYEADRAGEPSLAEITTAAIKALSNDKDGFLLQIEACRVDHANHAGNLAGVVRDGVALAEVIAAADEIADDADTLFIVTADHEHAIAFGGYRWRGSDITGLCIGIDNAGERHNGTPEIADDGKPCTVVGYLNGSGTILREDVAVYAKGPFAHLFDGTIEQSVIFHVMHHPVTAE